MFRRSLPLLLLLPTIISAQESVPGLKVPPGFVVTQFADHTLANDIYCMTVDSKGRIVVSGRGYIKILIDDDNDGKADRALDFANSPKDGAMGLHWEKDTLFVTGDGGLRRFVDKDGDGKADGPSELIRRMKTGGEHTSHAVKRGPDGWLYVLCGDGAGVDKSFATLPTSPIKDPVGGCVIRFTPDLKNSEIVAHGFRNAYGMDFSFRGELFTYDSDNERCLSLPWYEPTRFYQVIDGGFYGWLAPQRAKFWRMPPYFFDVVPPVTYLGRGSPTGVVFSGNKQFPEKYRGGFLALDWTFGKIYYLDPSNREPFRKPEVHVFLEATGDNGFAPTAGAIHPQTGDLYVSVGGRGTRGAIYRIRYPARFAKLASLKDDDGFPVVPSQRLDFDPKGQALEFMLPHDRIYYARRFSKEWSASSLMKTLGRCWESHDQVTRQHAIEILKSAWPRLPADEKAGVLRNDSPSQKLVTAAALVHLDLSKSLELTESLLHPDFHPDIVLGAIRVLQLSMGDIGASTTLGTFREGYTLRASKLPSVFSNDRKAILAGSLVALIGISPEINREVARTAILLGDWESVCDYMLDKRDDPINLIHYVMCIAAANDDLPTDLAVDLIFSIEKSIRRKGLAFESNGPLRQKEVLELLSRKNKDLLPRILKRPDFGNPDHLIYTKIKDFPRLAAASAFAKRIDNDLDYQLSPGIIFLLAELPPKFIIPRARKWWSDPSLRPSLLPILAKMPEAQDYPRFVEGIKIGSPSLIETSLNALKKLPLKKDIDGSEPFALLRALSVVSEKQTQLRLDLLARLAFVTGLGDAGHDLNAWRSWFRKTHPKLAARLENPDGVDITAWEKRLGKIAWDAGDATRGAKAFTKASCVQCHGGSASVGPDLAGATGRFSRADLFTAILRPSKDVADRYRTTMVETKEGKTHQGLVIYDAIDSLILHTREGTTVRLLGGEIAERRQIDVSPMPSGLLDALDDTEIADLYAYLRAKSKPKTE